jgi:signal transduction histidine kinase
MINDPEINVLIIDDSPEDRETYRRLLARRPDGAYAVTEAATGAEGLRAVQTHAPDCILLDYRLPDTDGLSLVKTLNAECGSVPIVFLTGAANEELAAAALSAGVQDYLSKDRVDGDSLARSLRYAIERNRTSARINALNRELREELGRRVEELRAAHAEAMRNERLAALGTLAAGVAHDLNNPLMGVITHVQFGMRKMRADDAQARDALEKALKYSKRCADIVNDLLAYARHSLRQPAAECDLRGNVYRALDEAVADTRATREAAAVALTLDLEPGLPPIRFDNSGMRQVFVNLIENACHAVRGRDERVLRVCAAREDGHVTVTVADSGQGMDDETRARAFEPFFTTKTTSGTGLGLSLCKKLLESVGGEISIASVVDEGTTFTLRLPAAAPIATEQQEAAAVAAAEADGIADAGDER